MRNHYKRDEPVVKSIDASQLKRLAKYMRPYAKQLWLTVLVMFAATIIDNISPLILQISVDDLIPNQKLAWLVLVSISYGIAVVLGYIFTRIKIKLANRTGQYVLFDLRRDLFNHVQGLSLNFFDANSAGTVMVRIVNDINTMSNLFTNGFVNVISEISVLVVIAVGMFIIHPRLALVTLASAPLFMGLLILTRNEIRRRWREMRRKISSLNSYLHENIVGMKVIQAYVRQKENNRVFYK